MTVMNRPLISVIVPIYMVEQYLDECVGSLRSQTLKNIEIILVDDGSPDNCPAMCDKYSAEDERIKVIHKESGGVSDARNKGIDAATGEYLFFIDSDDYAMSEMCGALHSLAEETNADIVCGGFLEIYGDDRRPWKDDGLNTVYSGKEALSELLKGNNVNGFVWGKLYRRELFDNVRFQGGMIYEDLYISPDIYLKAEKVAVTHKPLCVYRHRGGSLTSEKYTPKVMDAVKACRRVYDTVVERAPELEPEAWFRLSWSYFHVLDRMLYEKDYRSLEGYDEVIGYLKKNWKKIYKCSYFTSSRRSSALALKAGMFFYKIMWKQKIRKHGGFVQ